MRISSKYKIRHLRTRVVQKIEDVPAEQWNKIFPKVPEGYNFLKTLDESKFHQFTFYYILVYEHRQLVGAAPCFSLDYSLDTSINGPLRRVTNAVKKIFPRIFCIKALVCGIPMGQGQIGISGFTSAIPEAIERRMEALARKIHAPIIAFKDFDSSYDNYFKPFENKGFIRIDSLPMTRMELGSSNFDEYLNTLSSSTRYDFRRKLKKSSKIRVESTVVKSLDQETLDELYSLYLEAVDIHDMGFEILPKEFFHLISENMPKETRFFLSRVNGKLASFGFCLVSNGVLLDYYLGFDYTLNQEYHFYFIRFKEIISWCMANGIKTYEMGTTGYEPKRRLKFNLVPVYLYIRVRYKILRPFFSCLCALLKFENFDPVLKKWKRSLK